MSDVTNPGSISLVVNAAAATLRRQGAQACLVFIEDLTARRQAEIAISKRS